MRPTLAALVALAIYSAEGQPTPADPLGELHKSFTVDGKPVPPEIFADFGDSDLADSDPIVVAIDARAATGGNRYADPIRKNGHWIIQTKPNDKTLNGAEETAYEYVGATATACLSSWRATTGAAAGRSTRCTSSTRAWRPRSPPTARRMSA